MTKELLELYKHVFDELNLMIVVLSTEQTLLLANQTILDFSGSELEDVKGLPGWELPWWQHSQELQNQLMFTLGHVYSVEETMRFEATHMDKNGELFEIDFVVKPIVIDEEVKYIIAMGYNITEMVSAKKALTQREKQIKAFFEYSMEGYFFQLLPDAAIIPENLTDEFINAIYDAQRLSSYNKRVLEFIGSETIEESQIIESLGLVETNINEIWKEMLTTGMSTVRTKIINQTTGKNVFLKIRLIAIYDDAGMFEGNFCIVSDITQQYLYERELNFLANKDPLTGLNNRRNFHKQAQNMFGKDSNEENFSVCMIDIDHFKLVNDTHGHDVGDIVIRNVADSIEQSVGENAVVGRYGGEEFVVVFNIPSSKSMKLVESLRIRLENSEIGFGGGSLSITVSAGISDIGSGDEKLDKAIIYADKALYESKTNGRNQTTIYDDELHGRLAVDRLTGTFTRKSIKHRLQRIHKDLRKKDLPYIVIKIELETLIVSEFAILHQFIKQVAALLQGMTRNQDKIGRYDDMTFVLLIRGMNRPTLKNVTDRIEKAIEKLCVKFEDLIIAKTSSIYFDDAEMKFDDVIKLLDNL